MSTASTAWSNLQKKKGRALSKHKVDTTHYMAQQHSSSTCTPEEGHYYYTLRTPVRESTTKVLELITQHLVFWYATQQRLFCSARATPGTEKKTINMSQNIRNSCIIIYNLKVHYILRHSGRSQVTRDADVSSGKHIWNRHPVIAGLSIIHGMFPSSPLPPPPSSIATKKKHPHKYVSCDTKLSKFGDDSSASVARSIHSSY